MDKTGIQYVWSLCCLCSSHFLTMQLPFFLALSLFLSLSLICQYSTTKLLIGQNRYTVCLISLLSLLLSLSPYVTSPLSLVLSLVLSLSLSYARTLPLSSTHTEWTPHQWWYRHGEKHESLKRLRLFATSITLQGRLQLALKIKKRITRFVFVLCFFVFFNAFYYPRSNLAMSGIT